MIEVLHVKSSQRTELIDITRLVQESVRKSGVSEGTCHVFVPHTTAAVTINENADPSVIRDILMMLDRIVPLEGGYHHTEGNSAAHVKSSLLGCSQAILVVSGRLVLGTWQGIFFSEFDGPRSRKVYVKIAREEGSE